MRIFKSRKASSLFSGSALALSAALLAASPASAQDTPDDEIVVTGSRIPQDPNLISSVPVQSIDEDEIRLSGEINLADIVNDIPALISSLTGENSVTGANSLNLRGLGGERTLTLVNGRRHVAGFRGTSAVDTGSIPEMLVKSVEVTTGGASAVYGSDAVTGVVNFVLKDDFEGFQANAQGGVSTQGDAENFSISALYGKNFGKNDEGNLVLSVGYVDDSTITYGDRDWARNNGIASTEPRFNPLRRFQPNDLGADTPFFNSEFGSYGGVIPSADDIPAGVTLTSTEQALIARAAGAFPNAITQNPTFWLTSQAGSIAPGFGGRGTTYVDINNNGVADCQESLAGRTGFLAGCWITQPDGSVSVFQDGQIVTGGLWGSGGDGGAISFDRDTLYPETDKLSINLNGKYDLAPNLTAFFEAKFVNSETTTFAEQDTFYDTLFIQADNPYIPAELLPVVAQTGGLLLTQDPVDFNDNNPTVTERETIRFVGGLEWQTESGHNFEVAVNHGEFRNTQDFSVFLLDRQFAALDAVRDPATGEIVCRSDLDPTAAYEIDYFTAGNGYADGGFSSDRYYSFTPGDGQCRPANPFGTYSVSADAQNFINENVTDRLTLKQTTISLNAAGTFDVLSSLLDGDIGYAAGLEYRRESSNNELNDLTLGVLPQGTPFTAGALINTIDPFLNTLTSIDNDQQFNTKGSYDVGEAYAEARLPIFIDKPGAEELSVDGAIRFADYNTSGSTTTWKLGATWAPINDISLRGTLSKAVRAPNISELFDPQLPITISATADPCDPGNIDQGTSDRQANCVASLQAAGVALGDILDTSGDYIWANPLTGRFAGTSGGNPDLEPETADTFTIGAVLRPSFVDNLSLTVDYWDIKIENAIQAVASSDILSGCLDSADFPNVPFCGAFERRGDGGLTDLTTGQINFAALEASGIDFAANYSYDWGENTLGARLVGSYQEKLDRFFNPTDLTEVNPDLTEIQVPELSGNLLLSWERGPAYVGFQTSYQSSQVQDAIEFANTQAGNTLQDLFGPSIETGDTFIFDVNASYELNEQFSFYGGVNNIGDKQPFSTQTAWPVGPRGRFVFFGVNYKM